jgi:predicted nucleotidyltransferase
MSQNNYDILIVGALLRSDNHIRGLAKLLKTNQTTIARKVDGLHKQNIIDFKREGKNKVFFVKKTFEAKRYACIVETHKLLRLLTRYPSLRRAVELIDKEGKVDLAILFGSYAKGTANRDSDIDIYVDTKDCKLKEKIALIDSRISVKIGVYDKDSLLIKEIEKDHVIIKGAERFYEKNKFFD